MIPFLCSLSIEDKSRIACGPEDYFGFFPIQKLQSEDFSLKGLRFLNADRTIRYSSVSEHLEDGLIYRGERYIGINPKYEDRFMYSYFEADRQDTTFGVFVFYKGSKYRIVATPLYTFHEGVEYVLSDDMPFHFEDSSLSDSCFTFFIEEYVPYRVDTCSRKAHRGDYELLKKKEVRVCEDEMYESIILDSIPTNKCIVNFNDDEVDYIYVDSVDERPRYKGGGKAILAYLRRNFSAGKQKDEGCSFDVVFLIDPSYRCVMGAKIRNKDYDSLTITEQKILQVIEDMPRRWKPGKCGEDSVRTKESLQIFVNKRGKVVDVK